jgi:HAD superfamily hydrolase (TIGR01450 family)
LNVTELDLAARGYLIDLDGTLISGKTVLPDARALLGAVAGRYVLVSNNAEHTPNQLSRMLRSIGLTIASDRIVLAGTAAVDSIAAVSPGASLMLLGSPALKHYARRKGLRLDAPKPDIVLITRDRHFSYLKLAAAAKALSDGAVFYVAAPDLNHPGVNGEPVPETGALAAAILACAGPRDYTVIGKPERILFEMACATLGADFGNVIMIGDNPQTDGLGAQRLGMRFHHVQRGVMRLPFRQAAE